MKFNKDHINSKGWQVWRKQNQFYMHLFFQNNFTCSQIRGYVLVPWTQKSLSLYRAQRILNCSSYALRRKIKQQTQFVKNIFSDLNPLHKNTVLRNHVSSINYNLSLAFKNKGVYKEILVLPCYCLKICIYCMYSIKIKILSMLGTN